MQEHDEPGDDESIAGAAMNGAPSGSTTDLQEESEVEADISIDDTPEEASDSHLTVQRRSRLPAKPAGDEGSLFAVLKKNVGQVRLLVNAAIAFYYTVESDYIRKSSTFASSSCGLRPLSVSI